MISKFSPQIFETYFSTKLSIFLEMTERVSHYHLIIREKVHHFITCNTSTISGITFDLKLYLPNQVVGFDIGLFSNCMLKLCEQDCQLFKRLLPSLLSPALPRGPHFRGSVKKRAAKLSALFIS